VWAGDRARFQVQTQTLDCPFAAINVALFAATRWQPGGGGGGRPGRAGAGGSCVRASLKGNGPGESL
jgi:hypothetical protein